MVAASKNDAPRHFLSDSKALNGNGIFPESTSLSSQTDKSCRKVPQLDAQNPRRAYRGVQLRSGPRSAALLSGNHLPWERRFPGMASKFRSRHQHIDRPAASPAASVIFAITLVGEWRSEERRVGKECVSTSRSRWSQSRYKKKNKAQQDKLLT